MIIGSDGAISSKFEIYTSLKSTGTFGFYQDADPNAKTYGEGSTTGTLLQGGTPITTTEDGAVRITVDLASNTYEILPFSWSVVGSSIANGWSGDEPLNYQGGGIWSAQLAMDVVTSDTNPRFIFKGNRSWDYSMKKVVDSENSVLMASIASNFDISLEDIGLAYGNFIITLNLSDYTYSIQCVEKDNYKISFMGSSVCNGQGATNMQGYAYQYDQLLQERASNGSSPFYRSNISINGNNTIAVLDRFEKDLLGDCGKYVVFGLALGNEGIHENGESAFNQFNENLQLIISKTKAEGKIPVVMNNYTRADYTTSDYDYIKQMNLIIAQWDVASVNTLGAVDNGSGQWATGYKDDDLHPNDAGHTEMFYTMVPSLFDALEMEKPQPVFTTSTFITPDATANNNSLLFTPENTIHPFTVSFDIKTSGTGNLMTFTTSGNNGQISITSEGYIQYTSPSENSITGTQAINDDTWHKVTLTHYFAQGASMLYLDDANIGSTSENLEAVIFKLHGSGAPSSISYRNWLFYRSGMNESEINALNNGTLLKSSLELYAPLDGEAFLGNEPFANLAQSKNEIDFSGFSIVTTGNENVNTDINIYPNPVEDIIHISYQNALITEANIYDLLGTKVFSETNTSTLNVAFLPQGIYLLNLKTSLGPTTFKFIKE